MPKYNVKFTYKVPDRYQEDSWDLGLTEEYVYDGAEYIQVDLDQTTGYVVGHCFYEPEELERPIGIEDWRLTLDCKDEPMLCDLLDDKGDTTPWDLGFWPTAEESSEWTDEEVTEKYMEIWFKTPEGYPDAWKPKRCIPREIYDKDKIKYNWDTDDFEFELITSDKPSLDITWEDIRARRDHELQNTDQRISPDMPEDIVEDWKEYRQRLRDLPQKFQAMGLEPWQAAMSFPDSPDSGQATNPRG